MPSVDQDSNPIRDFHRGPRVKDKLTTDAILRCPPGVTLGDGGGLHLEVKAKGSGVWFFRFSIHGRRRDMGLGPYPEVSLRDARERAFEARKLLKGTPPIDPIEHRRAELQTAAHAAAKAMTFEQCALAYIASHEAGWKNAKHASQWRNTLTEYAFPIIGKKAVSAIDNELVMRVLDPIWRDKSETANRVRGRIESVLGWATVSGYRTGENPARWRGHLDKQLPGRAKVRKVKSHAAMKYTGLPAFMKRLRAREGAAAQALEFLILTAARTGEVIGAEIGEFDLKARVWTVPAERMKAGKDHVVPLAPRAVAIVRKAIGKRTTGPVFLSPGTKRRSDKPLSNGAMSALLNDVDRLNVADATVHGFRSTFKDWAIEKTDFPSEVSEMALAHTVADKVEAAYRRGNLFEKRAGLAAAWAAYALQKAD